jgi:hypothetical protein
MKKLVFMFFAIYILSWSIARAEENKLTNWLQNQWIETVEFQKKGWQDGKEQLTKNKLYVQDLFTKVKNYVAQD